VEGGRRQSLVDEARAGLERFRDKFWRCEAVDSGRRCRNYWEGHEKGHQFSPADEQGLLDSDDMAVGVYRSSYNADYYLERLWDEISHLGRQNADREIVVRRRLTDQAQRIRLHEMHSQRTCLACLSNCPTNVLPCRNVRNVQHAICEQCIRRYAGPPNESSWAYLSQCPLGCELDCELGTSPWTVRLKPNTAGARILALDG
jgi:hypothetical protein